MNPSYVPTRLIQPLVIEWLERRKQSFGSYTLDGRVPVISPRDMLAELANVNERTIRSIIHGERENLKFPIADRLLLAMDEQWQWHQGELGQWYSRRLRFSERELVA